MVRLPHEPDRNPQSGRLELGSWVIDFDSQDLLVNGSPCDLTSKEFEILTYLVRNIGQVVPRHELFFHVWGYDMEFNSNSLEVYIYRLRNKITSGHSRRSRIVTVRSRGYRLLPE